MTTTRPTIWHPAFWLTLLLLAFVSVMPAGANCSAVSHEMEASHACCAAHPAACRCAPIQDSTGRQNALHSGCGVTGADSLAAIHGCVA